MDNILYSIQTHTNFLDRALKSSVKIYEYALEGNAEKIEQETLNRERLIEILQKLQEIVNLNMNNLTPIEQKSYQDIMKAWQHDLSEWINTISDLDEEVIKILEEHKVKTSEEIARAYSNHKKFKGYNLKNLKG